MVRTDAARAGIGLGSAIAVAISWSLHGSIVWAAIHGFFGWFYVLYHALTRPGGLFG
ncbi:MAG: hypothetical protein ABJF09_12665 [Qipengyuania citrea]|uniref:hypothetical protein n=1 Tax=Qipengyuania TaxID=1855416 RepID=UPI000ACCA167|nr:hypothetical protein [Qipengyuania citrea]MCD1591186.1 hypothetical protein [Qipengyuania citrea]MDP7325996.1 hypothetical protein [Qipengyuania citrea]